MRCHRLCPGLRVRVPAGTADPGSLAWINALLQDLPGDRGYDDPTQASRPFSKDRRGFVPAEGVGGIFLSRPDYVRQRGWPIKGMILGGYANSDAGHLTRLAQDNVALCMQRALEAAGCNRKTSTALTPTRPRHPMVIVRK